VGYLAKIDEENVMQTEEATRLGALELLLINEIETETFVE
jgi:hypothetical protein